MRRVRLAQFFDISVVIAGSLFLVATYKDIGSFSARLAELVLLSVLGYMINIKLDVGMLCASKAMTIYIYFTYGLPEAVWITFIGGLIYDVLRHLLNDKTNILTARILYFNCQDVVVIVAASKGLDVVTSLLPALNTHLGLTLKVVVCTLFMHLILNMLEYIAFRLHHSDIAPSSISMRNLSWLIYLDAFAGFLGYLMVILHTFQGIGGFYLMYATFMVAGLGFKSFHNYLKANNELSTLYETGAILGRTLDIDDILNSVLTAAQRLVNPDSILVFLLDDEGKRYSSFVVRGTSMESFQDNSYTIDEGVTGMAITEGRPVLIKGRRRLISYGLENEIFSAILAVPMIHGGQTWGCITVCSKYLARFDDRHADMLKVLASYAAISVSNAKRYIDVKHEAITDHLTGLYNYHHFTTKLAECIEKSNLLDEPVSLIMIDLDKFKSINDTFGHQAGNELLIQLSGVISNSVRQSDIVARFGGEEIAIILPNTNKTIACFVAERIRQDVFSSVFKLANTKVVVRITISLGVATCPVDAIDDYGLIEAADKALYQEAKQKGRNRVGLANRR